jgi:hypothetical protein
MNEIACFGKPPGFSDELPDGGDSCASILAAK